MFLIKWGHQLALKQTVIGDSPAQHAKLYLLNANTQVFFPFQIIALTTDTNPILYQSNSMLPAWTFHRVWHWVDGSGSKIGLGSSKG